MKVETIKREFRLNGMTLPDPVPGMSIEDVRNLYASSGYPQLLNAKIIGPTYEGDTAIYTFEQHVGHKG